MSFSFLSLLRLNLKTWTQCCGSGINIPDPNLPSRVHGQKDSGSRIQICTKEFKYFQPYKLFLSHRKNDLGCSLRIRIFSHPGPGFFYVPDPGVKKLRIRNFTWTTSGHTQMCNDCVSFKSLEKMDIEKLSQTNYYWSESKFFNVPCCICKCECGSGRRAEFYADS